MHIYLGQTRDHEKVYTNITLITPRPGGQYEAKGYGLELHITHELYPRGSRQLRSCGAGSDTYGAIATYAPGWDAGTIEYLIAVARRWHLNGMNAGCSHQRLMGWTWTTHPSAICPICNYSLGHGWQFEELPADVLAWVQSLGVTPEVGLN